MRKEKSVTIATETELNILLNSWVQILDLKDWEIYAILVSKSDMDEEELGRVEYNMTSNQALIKILNPSDFCNDYFNWDMEETLVHELLHVKYGLLTALNEENDLKYSIEHRLVESLARQFVRLRRREV